MADQIQLNNKFWLEIETLRRNRAEMERNRDELYSLD